MIKKDIQRFWSKVDMKSKEECWNMSGFIDKDGYGKFWINDRCRSIGAHRVAYEITHGKFDEEFVICHTCDNPRCVNPNHLFLGTQNDNIQDKLKKGRQAKGDKHGTRTKPEAYAEMRKKNFKFSMELVREIRSLQFRLTYRELSKRFGISVGQIGNIMRRTCRKEQG